MKAQAFSLAIVVAVAALIPIGLPAIAQTAAAGFALPVLPYSAAALEPAIDAHTMKLHHGMHHQAYLTALNAAIAAKPRTRAAVA